MPRKLTRPFYLRPALEVSRELLGKVLVKVTDADFLRARIVEVEAYTGQADPGSHAYRGMTARNQVMFGPGGHLYVYFTYGMHYCANIVSDEDGTAGAVLLRAAEPLEGLETMQARRPGRPVHSLCDGPAKLCQAFAIDKRDNGNDLTQDQLWIEDDDYSVEGITETTRIGLSRGADLVQRFYLSESKFVSRRSTR